MECIICCESMLHLFHEPMSMGCKCQERLCQRCFKVGGVTKCPTCRKFKKQPKVDRKLLRKHLKQGELSKCLGCEKEVCARYLHRHEMKCCKYRDVIQRLFEEDLRVRRTEGERTERAMADMESRLDLQADTIDELEDQVEFLERVSRRQEEERQLYVIENGRLLRSLDSVLNPLFTNVQSLESVYSLMRQAACTLRASRVHHQVLNRQHHLSAVPTTLPPAASVQPAQPPAMVPPLASVPVRLPAPAPAVLTGGGGGLPAQSPPLPSHLQTPRLLHRTNVDRNDDETLTLEEGEMIDDDDDDDASNGSSSA